MRCSSLFRGTSWPVVRDSDPNEVELKNVVLLINAVQEVDVDEFSFSSSVDKVDEVC